MADALISPMVAVTMLATTVGLATYSVHKVQNEMDNKKIPLMGVMGAFIFAAQMINFTIPGTGSSGHIGGGMLLTILLGPYAGFLTMASILLIQALFFADGGLLAYGCNVFNLGFFACFIAYPMIYKYLTRKAVTPRRILLASLISVVVALQLGAFSVVLETFFSGQTELPFSTFVLMMQPMHLAIGLVEGLVTAAIVTFIWQARPEIINRATTDNSLGNPPITKVVIGLAIAVILVGGGLSWFTSAKPDGLEWSILQIYGSPELAATDAIYQKVAAIQKQTA
ncbi:MAG: energy-coupling factor ABC transporter permease, partial [Methylocystaceae bacterium]